MGQGTGLDRVESYSTEFFIDCIYKYDYVNNYSYYEIQSAASAAAIITTILVVSF
jgi:hypothetical protein